MSPSQASETCASASSATSANGNSLYESRFEGVKKRSPSHMRRADQKKCFWINIAAGNSESANSCQSLAGM